MWLFILYIIAEKSVIMNEAFLVDVSIHYYPYAFLKKQAKGILLSPPSARPSVSLSARPLCYLFLNHWAKFGVRDTHMNGACNGAICFAPPPGALGRGQKVKYHLISIT